MATTKPPMFAPGPSKPHVTHVPADEGPLPDPLPELLGKAADQLCEDDIILAFSAFQPTDAVAAAVETLARRAAANGVRLRPASAAACARSAWRLRLLLDHGLLANVAASERTSPSASRLLDTLMAYCDDWPLSTFRMFAALGFADGVRDPCDRSLLHYSFKAAGTPAAAAVQAGSEHDDGDAPTLPCDLDAADAESLVEELLRRAAAAAGECSCLGLEHGSPCADAAERIVNTRDCWGATPVHHLCLSGGRFVQRAVAEALLQRGANTAIVRLYSNLQPLHSVCLRGKWSLVRPLLLAGADPLARDAVGCTPADFAAAGRSARLGYMSELLDVFELETGGPGPGIDWPASRLRATLLPLLMADRVPVMPFEELLAAVDADAAEKPAEHSSEGDASKAEGVGAALGDHHHAGDDADHDDDGISSEADAAAAALHYVERAGVAAAIEDPLSPIDGWWLRWRHADGGRALRDWNRERGIPVVGAARGSRSAAGARPPWSTVTDESVLKGQLADYRAALLECLPLRAWRRRRHVVAAYYADPDD